MARGKREDQLKVQVMKRHETLLAERADIGAEIKGCEQYLKAVGEIKPRKRGRRKKSRKAA